MRNGLGVMTDLTCLGELLGMAELPMPLGLSDAAAWVSAVRTFTVLRSFFLFVLQIPLHVLTLPSLLEGGVEKVGIY